MTRLTAKRVLKFIALVPAIAIASFTLFYFRAPLTVSYAPTMEVFSTVYLYPIEEMEIDITLDSGDETDCWYGVAIPGGTAAELEYQKSGGVRSIYSYCVRGEETEDFLRKNLTKAGCTSDETETFIQRWLPYMFYNPYNRISLLTADYEKATSLAVTPAPDSVLRLLVFWEGSWEYASSYGYQIFKSFPRAGFTAVELAAGRWVEDDPRVKSPWAAEPM